MDARGCIVGNRHKNFCMFALGSVGTTMVSLVLTASPRPPRRPPAVKVGLDGQWLPQLLAESGQSNTDLGRTTRRPQLSML